MLDICYLLLIVSVTVITPWRLVTFCTMRVESRISITVLEKKHNLTFLTFLLLTGIIDVCCIPFIVLACFDPVHITIPFRAMLWQGINIDDDLSSRFKNESYRRLVLIHAGLFAILDYLIFSKPCISLFLVLFLACFALLYRIPLFVAITRGRVFNRDPTPREIYFFEYFRKLELHETVAQFKFPRELTLAVVHTIRATLTDLAYFRLRSHRYISRRLCFLFN